MSKIQKGSKVRRRTQEGWTGIVEIIQSNEIWVLVKWDYPWCGSSFVKMENLELI